MRRSGGLAVRALFVLCAAAASGNVGAQTASLTTVGTVAGGARGYADGVGTLAKFHTPSDLVLLGDGTVLVADKGNGAIRHIDTQRTVSKRTGGTASSYLDGGCNEALIGAPFGLALSQSGAVLYVTDGDNAKLRTVSATASEGDCVVRRLDYSAAEEGLQTPVVPEAPSDGCCVGMRGQMFGSNLYLSSSETHQIVKVNMDKEQALSVVAGSGISGGSDGAATAASFSGPLDVAVDPDGIYAYVADTGNHLIRRIHLFYNQVTTVAGQFEVKGCADGLATAALLNSPTALVVTPNGERLLFVEGVGDSPNHVVREYRLAPPDKLAVRTIAGSCGERGWQDGSPLQSLFYAPKGLAVSPDGALAVIADAGNHAIRSLSICDNAVCEYGRWRGPCDVTYMGKCVACTKSINSTITKAATPFNQDSCEWECSVGHWQVDQSPCTKGDTRCARCRPCTAKLPKNSSFSTNGGMSDSCKWACDRGFELNDKGDACSFIPLSKCYETTVTSAAGSLCEGQNFTLKGCAANKAAHQRLAEELASWLDMFLQMEDECDILLYNGSSDLRQALRSYLSEQSKVQGALQITPAENLGPAAMDLVKEVNESGLCGMSQGVPLDYWYQAQDKAPAAQRCKAACPLREVLVQAVLGTCTSYKDCPRGLNSSKLPCCFALTEMTEKSCEGFSFSLLGQYSNQAQVAGVCNSQSDCVKLSGVPSGVRGCVCPMLSLACLLAAWLRLHLDSF